jgi:hypothetical protein
MNEIVFEPSTKYGASCAVVKIPSVPVKHPIGSEEHVGYEPPRFADAISVPLIQTELVSSARTLRLADVIAPLKLNVSENVTAVPLGTTTKPGLEVSPVLANETQLEPASGPAHAAFPTIFWVALPELFVVFVEELASDVLSAFAVIKQPLARIRIASFLNINPPRGSSVKPFRRDTQAFAFLRCKQPSNVGIEPKGPYDACRRQREAPVSLQWQLLSQPKNVAAKRHRTMFRVVP